MAAPDRLRENSHLQGKQSRGWSAWTLAKVPPDSNRRNLEPRGPGQVGYMSLSIETALGDLAELCGIYEWKERELDLISLTMLFYMLEVRVSFANLKNWGAESFGTANTEVIKRTS